MFSKQHISWGQIGEDIFNDLENKERKIKESAIIVRKHEFNDLPTMKELLCSGRIKLERFDRAFEYLTKTCGVKIGHKQEKLYFAIRTTFLPLMFGSDLISNIQYLKNNFNIKEIYNMFAGIYPRREGKTVITAIAAAIFMVSQPNGNVICYNIYKRQADNWMDQLLIYLNHFRNSNEFGWTEISKSGKESYHIYCKATDTINMANSYPCGLTDGTIGNNFFKKNFFRVKKKKHLTHTHHFIYFFEEIPI